ncbi:MAG: tetratricopeptide repeat protein [Proteobacteria bacterium]|nr:tetratricopeptide repeat protein [Pseudomonadota bacterium]
MRVLILFFWLSVFNGLFFGPVEIVAREVREVSPMEIEDRDFIRNLYQDKHYRFAEEEAQDYLKKYPEGLFRAEVIFIRAQINATEKFFHSALQKYDLITKKHPNSPYVEDSLYLGGVLQIQLGEEEKGRNYFKGLLDKFPKSKFRSKVYFHLGQLAFKEKQWKLAENSFRTATEADDLSRKRKLEALNYLAWTFHFQDKKNRAKDIFLELLKSEIEDVFKARISFQLAVDAQKEKNYRKAIDWYELLLLKWPHPDFRFKSEYWMAESLFLIHQISPEELSKEEKEKAVELYSRNLGLKHPIGPENSRYHRGWLYLALQQAGKAENDFRWLQENSPEYAGDMDLTLIRADYFEKEKNWSEANRIYIPALEVKKDPNRRNLLVSRIIRNSYRLKDCASVSKWNREIERSIDFENADEMFYYSGRCHFVAEQWEEAGNDFSKIPLSSRFAKLVFDEYLDVFRKTHEYSEGVDLLEEVRKHPPIASQERILTLKIEFCLALETWLPALDAMNQLKAITPEKEKDPWFAINMAKVQDRIAVLLNDDQWPNAHLPAQPASFYEDRALSNYQSAYRRLPEKDVETKLAVLEILIERYEQRKDFEKMVEFYQAAVESVDDGDRRSKLILRIADILITHLDRKQEARTWLVQLHNKGDQDINFSASSLLSELLIDEKDYTQAIDVLLELAQQPIEDTRWYSNVHFRLGELYQSRESWIKAIKHYDLVAKSARDNPLKKEARIRMSNIKKYITQQKIEKQGK